MWQLYQGAKLTLKETQVAQSGMVSVEGQEPRNHFFRNGLKGKDLNEDQRQRKSWNNCRKTFCLSQTLFFLLTAIQAAIQAALLHVLCF